VFRLCGREQVATSGVSGIASLFCGKEYLASSSMFALLITATDRLVIGKLLLQIMTKFITKDCIPFQSISLPGSGLGWPPGHQFYSYLYPISLHGIIY
jgi:hypothetical protein